MAAGRAPSRGPSRQHDPPAPRARRTSGTAAPSDLTTLICSSPSLLFSSCAPDRAVPKKAITAGSPDTSASAIQRRLGRRRGPVKAQGQFGSFTHEEITSEWPISYNVGGRMVRVSLGARRGDPRRVRWSIVTPGTIAGDRRRPQCGPASRTADQESPRAPARADAPNRGPQPGSSAPIVRAHRRRAVAAAIRS